MTDAIYWRIHRALHTLIMSYELSNRLHAETAEILASSSKLFTAGYIDADQFDRIQADFGSVQREIRQNRNKISGVLSAYFSERRSRSSKFGFQFQNRSTDFTDDDITDVNNAVRYIRSRISEYDDDSAYEVELPFATKEEIRDALSTEIEQ